MPSIIPLKTLKKMGAKDVRKLQLAKLRTQIKFLYENNVFYRRKLKESNIHPDDIRSFDDFVKVPFTTKEEVVRDIVENPPFGSRVSVPCSKLVRFHITPGPKGVFIPILFTKKDVKDWIKANSRALLWAGVRRNDIVQITFGYTLFIAGMMFHLAVENLGALPIPVGPGNTKQQVKIIKDYGSTVLIGTPSYALRILEELENNGIDPEETRLRKFIGAAEPWVTVKGFRDEFKRKWKIIKSAIDYYGLGECAPVSVECPNENGGHIVEDYVYVEVVDPRSGEPLEPEEEGEIVITHLSREATPLLRYRTSDVSYIIEDSDCEIPFRRLGGVFGRIDDMRKVKGVKVFSSQVLEVLRKYNVFTGKFQMIISKKGPLDYLKLVIEHHKDREAQTRGILKKLREDLREMLLIRPDEIVLVEEGSYDFSKTIVDKRFTEAS